ncbi:NAD(P)/FAD-dependent oxidoreductase [Terrabacter sp. GCM10028922]|uniref:NAD(P)/FAD-dependent oxidoreductase n=1 Tax=Terrabacter sp. GCM10028922 TaxID=3273428 RepID=UPI00361D696A
MTGTERGAPLVVVGGGVLGLCTAYYLRQAGSDVVLLDRATPGSGASWGNAGWVCQSLSTPVPAPGIVGHAARTIGRPQAPVYLRPELTPEFARWMWHFWRATSPARFAASATALTSLIAPAFDQLAELEDAGLDTSLTRPGLVHAFLSAEIARDTLQTQQRFAAGVAPVPEMVLTGSRARALDPALGAEVAAGYLVPGEGLVNPEVFTAAVTKWLIEHDVAIHEHTTATGFEINGGRVTGVLHPHGWIPCAGVVVAAGTWSGGVLRELGVDLPLQAGKGYSFSVALPSPPQRPLYLGDKHIVASPMAGMTRLAGTMEFSGNNLRLDWRRIVSIALASRHYLGDWFTSPDELMGRISSPWVGGRPMLPDGLPVIDRLSHLPNAFVSTGHGMLGIALGTASGKALAQFIVTGKRPRVLDPFTLGRLPGRRGLLPRD